MKLLNNLVNPQLYCIQCKEDNIPFQKLLELQFQVFLETGVCKDIGHLDLSIDNNHLKKYFDDINNLSFSNDDSHPTNLNCRYYDIPSFVKLKKTINNYHYFT